MKGDFSFQTIFIVLEIVMLIFFGILIIRLLGSFTNPDLQTALLNTQVLKSKINEACITGSSQMDGFRLTQPALNKAFTTLSTGFAKFAIKSSGDPQYVLYYEAFPYGEGVGWEALQGFDNRIFAYYEHPNDNSEQFSIGVNDFENDLWRSADPSNPSYLTRVDLLVGEKFGTNEGKEILKDHPEVLAYRRYVLVNNIELTEKLGAIPAYSVYNAPADENPGSGDNSIPQPEFNINPEERIRSITESFGAWNEDRTFFKFSNYLGLNDIEQSFIKYRPCGENSLCLKTREGVYRFPLDKECKNIKYIGIFYDRRHGPDKKLVFGSVIAAGVLAIDAFFTKGILTTGITKNLRRLATKLPGLAGGGLLYLAREVVAEVADATLSYKRSDFYFASPCGMPGTIEIQRVRSRDICDKSLRYPIYSYSGDTVVKTGEHISCMTSIGDDFSDDYSKLDPVGNDDNCLQVVVVKERPKDFCWTPNPDPNGFYKDGHFSIETRNNAKIAGALPISTNSFYMGDIDNNEQQVVFVKKIELQNAAKHLFASVFDVDWVWPSGFLLPQTK